MTHHCEEIPPGFTHGGLVSGGTLMAAGPLGDVITSAQVSTCFGVSVTVGCSGRSVVESRRLTDACRAHEQGGK